jgi:hypothetical protein
MKNFKVLTGLSLAVLFCLLSLQNLMAQDKAQKAEKKSGQANVQGTIQTINKDKSTIMVKTDKEGIRIVTYDTKTKFLYGHSNDNKPGSIAKVSEQNFISCAGTLDAKSQLTATECVYREGK